MSKKNSSILKNNLSYIDVYYLKKIIKKPKRLNYFLNMREPLFEAERIKLEGEINSVKQIITMYFTFCVTIFVNIFLSNLEKNGDYVLFIFIVSGVLGLILIFLSYELHRIQKKLNQYNYVKYYLDKNKK